MSKSFAIALLAPALAFARGDNSGFGRENAIETVLLERIDYTDDRLILYTYNAVNGETAEVHGDLTLEYGDDQSMTSFQNRYREFGFCIEMDSGAWDCMKVRTDLLQDTVLGTSWNFSDENGALEGGIIYSTPDTDANAEDSSLSWVNIAAASSIVGCELRIADPVVQGCTEINAHWYRNFETSQAEVDVQLSVDDVDKEWNVVGFSFQSYRPNFDFSDKGISADAVKQVKLVYPFLWGEALSEEFYVHENTVTDSTSVQDVSFYSYGVQIMREQVSMFTSSYSNQFNFAESGDQLDVLLSWDGFTLTEQVLWNQELSFSLEETHTSYDSNTSSVSYITDGSQNGEYVLRQVIDFEEKWIRYVISDAAGSYDEYEFINIFWFGNREWSQALIDDKGELLWYSDSNMTDTTRSSEQGSHSDNDLLVLKSESAPEPQTEKTHATTAYIYGGVSVAALSVIACAYMSKRKNAISDDFERVQA